MNNLIQSLKKRITNNGEPIVIEKNTFYVVEIDASANGGLLLKAERLAKSYLKDDEKELRAQKITAKEKKEVCDQLYLSSNSDQEKMEIDRMVNDMKSRYDLDLMMERLRLYGQLICVESLRTKEGEKVYSDNESRNMIMDMLAASPQTMQEISEAQGKISKKKIEASLKKK